MTAKKCDNFTRFSDSPSGSNPGKVKLVDDLNSVPSYERSQVAASLQALANLELQLRGGLQDFTTKIEEEVTKAVEKINKANDNNSAKDKYTELVIKDFISVPHLENVELRWSLPYAETELVTQIFVSSTGESFSNAIKIGEVRYPNSTFIEPARASQKFYWAKLIDPIGSKESPVVGPIHATQQVLENIVTELSQRIKISALDPELLKQLDKNTSEAISKYVTKALEDYKTEVNALITKSESVKEAVDKRARELTDSFNSEIQRIGTSIIDYQRKTDKHAEDIKGVTAKADDALAGVKEAKLAIADQGTAFAENTRQIQAKIDGVQAALTEETRVRATEHQASLDAIKQAKTEFGGNLNTLTESVTQIATAQGATNQKLGELESSTSQNAGKITQLEETQATDREATATRLNNLRASAVSNHYYNYNFEYLNDGWEDQQSVTAELINSTDATDPSTKLMKLTGATQIYYFEGKTLVPVLPNDVLKVVCQFKTRAQFPNIKVGIKFFTKHKLPLKHVKANQEYSWLGELAQSNQKANEWNNVSGSIKDSTDKWPIDPTDDFNKIPLNAAYAVPIIKVTAPTNLTINIGILDLLNITQSSVNEANIQKLEKVKTDAEKSLAEYGKTVEAKFNQNNTEVSKLIKAESDARKSLAEEVSRTAAKVSENESAINRVDTAVTDFKSSTATQMNDLKTKFRTDLSNKVKNPKLISTLDGWASNPTQKLKYAGSASVPQAIKDKFGEYNYAKFFGTSILLDDPLEVVAGDRVFGAVSVGYSGASVPVTLALRFKLSNNTYQNVVLATSQANTSIRLSGIKNAPTNAESVQLFIYTDNTSLSENQAVYLTDAVLRSDNALIETDASISEMKTSVSNANQAINTIKTSLKAAFGVNSAGQSDTIITEADVNSAVTQRITNYRTNSGKGIADLETKINTTSSNLESVSAKVETLTAEFGESKSKLTKVEKAVSDINKSSTEWRRDAESHFNDLVERRVETVTREFKSQLENKVTEAERKATEAKTAITNYTQSNDNAVSALGESVRGLDGKYQQEVTRVRSEITSAVDDIQIGGRNLAKDSFNATNTRHGYLKTYPITKAPAYGDKVTITVWGELGSTRTGEIGVYNTFGRGELFKLTKVKDGVWRGQGLWGKHTGADPDRQNETLALYAYPNTPANMHEVNNLFTHAKFEIGNKATDWTPAPEDLESKVEDIAQWRVTAQSSLEQVQRTVNGLEGSVAAVNESLDSRFSTEKTQTVEAVRTELNPSIAAAKSQADKGVADAAKAKDAADQSLRDAKSYADTKKSEAISEANEWKQVTARTDLNTLKETGRFFIKATPNPNSPITNWLYVVVEKGDNNRINQKIQADNDPTIRYYRYFNGSTWSDWVKEANLADVTRVDGKVDEVTTKVNNLRVSGRNLLAATRKLTTFYPRVNIWHYVKHPSEPQARIEPISSGDGYSYTDPDGNTVDTSTNYIQLVSAQTGRYATWLQYGREGSRATRDDSSPILTKIQPGRWYTLGCEVRKTPGSANTRLSLRIREQLKDYNVHDNMGVVDVTSEDWKPVSVTVFVDYHQGISKHDLWAVLFESNTAGHVHIRKPMLVEGNVPADWAEAPEDLERNEIEFAADFQHYKSTLSDDRQALSRQITQLEAGLGISANLIADSEFAEGLEEQALKEDLAATGYVRCIVAANNGRSPKNFLPEKAVRDLNIGCVGRVNQASPGSYSHFNTYNAPIIPGIYQFSIYVRNDSKVNAEVYANFLDETGGQIAAPPQEDKYWNKRTTTTIQPAPAKSGTLTLSDFTRVVFNVDTTHMTNLRYLGIVVRLDGVPANKVGQNVVLFCRPQIVKIKKLGLTEAVEYSPGPSRTSARALFTEERQARVTETESLVKQITRGSTAFPNGTGDINQVSTVLNQIMTATANQVSANLTRQYQLEIGGANLIENSDFKAYPNLQSYPNPTSPNRTANFNEFMYPRVGTMTPLIIPDVGLNGSNALRLSWTDFPSNQNKGIQIAFTKKTWQTGLFYILAVAARLPAGVNVRGCRVRLDDSLNPRWSDVEYINQPELTNDWQWTICKARKTQEDTNNQIYITVNGGNSPTLRSVEFCLPYASQGSAWGGYKAPAISATLTETKEIALDAQGKVNAKIGMTVDAGGRIIGWEAQNRNNSTEFTILADKLKVKNSSNQGGSPFTIENGEVVFNGKVKFANVQNSPAIPSTSDINRAVQAASRTDDNIRNLVRTTTEINGANITTGTVTADKVILNPGKNLVFNALLSNPSPFSQGQVIPEEATAYDSSPAHMYGWNWWAREGKVRVGICGKGDRRWGTDEYDGYESFVGIIQCPYTRSQLNPTNAWRGWLSQVIDVIPGKQYLLSCQGGGHRSTAVLAVENYDETGTKFRSANAELVMGADNYPNFVSGRDSSLYSKVITAPATGKICIAFSMKNITGDNPYIFFTRPCLEEYRGTNQRTSPWRPGSQSMINSKGDVIARDLSAISANLGHVTAGSINIAGKFRVDANGEVTISTGSVAGLKITNQRIDVLDEAGVLRVRLGKLTD